MVTQEEKDKKLAHLFIAANGGDKLAYTQFLNAISSDLRRFLARRINKSDIDDVLQEILISLHKSRHTYDGKRPILPWISTIARFRLTDYFRQHYAKADFTNIDINELSDSLADTATEENTSYDNLNSAVKLLPEKQQKIIYLMHTEGYTAKEVGSQLSMNESAVKVAAHRAYKTIKTKLGQ